MTTTNRHAMTPPPARRRPGRIACQAGVLASVLGLVLARSLSLGTDLHSMFGIGLWLLACAVLGTWMLAACAACLALDRRVFTVAMLLCAGLITAIP